MLSAFEAFYCLILFGRISTEKKGCRLTGNNNPVSRLRQHIKLAESGIFVDLRQQTFIKKIFRRTAAGGEIIACSKFNLFLEKKLSLR